MSNKKSQRTKVEKVYFHDQEGDDFRKACAMEKTTRSKQLRQLATRWAADRLNDRHAKQQKEVPSWAANRAFIFPGRVSFSVSPRAHMRM